MKNNNVALEFFKTATERHDDVALIFKGRPHLGEKAETRLTFSELAKIASSFACEFRKCGISPGDRSVVMLRYSPEFIATVFALFAIGAIPVLIDPGMGLSRLLHCISETKPRGFFAIPLAHWVRFFRPNPFLSVEVAFSTEGFFPPFCEIRKIPSPNEVLSAKIVVAFDLLESFESDLAAILFTTGSTGPAKGVEYTYGIFNAQLEMIRKYYGAGPKHIDMPCFPLFAMFSLCLGMPCVIPSIDPSRPAKAEPKIIVDAIIKHKVSFSFASPTLWGRVATYCEKENIRLNSLQKVLMAGAPVSELIHESIKKIISSDADTIIPYGATEALPIANFAGCEMLAKTAVLTAKGKGYCVGYPVKECEIRIISPSNGIIKKIEDVKFLPNGEIGEIIVKGAVVTASYYGNSKATALAKISDGATGIWHRMGDMGYFDGEGRLWFCGRKSHVVKTREGFLYPVCCEAPFNILTKRRCALVAVGEAGDENPVLVVEGNFSDCEFRELTISLRECAMKNEETSRISRFVQLAKFPVDIRHNAKISREEIRDLLNSRM